MVTTLLAAVLLVGVQESPAPGATVEARSNDADLQAVLGEKKFPWYDARAEKVVPLLSWPDWDSGWLKRGGDWFEGLFRPIRDFFQWLNFWKVPFLGRVGDLLVVGLAMLFLTLLLVGLLELLRRYRPAPLDRGKKTVVQLGEARSIEGLPAGVRIGDGDPWQEALIRRARGDYAGAVVYLFAHQLICLERLKQIRLVPGKTARQLIRTVSDGALRGSVEPTLRLFELVYYGHRSPSAEAVESGWTLAEQFEKRRLEGGAT